MPRDKWNDQQQGDNLENPGRIKRNGFKDLMGGRIQRRPERKVERCYYNAKGRGKGRQAHAEGCIAPGQVRHEITDIAAGNCCQQEHPEGQTGGGTNDPHQGKGYRRQKNELAEHPCKKRLRVTPHLPEVIGPDLEGNPEHDERETDIHEPDTVLTEIKLDTV